VKDVPWELVWHPNQAPFSGADPVNTLAVNPSQSTTFEVVGEGEFDIEYLDGTSSKGDYFTDIFEIGGATLQNMTMGLGVSTDISYGLVGVGYASNEAIVANTQSLSSVYPNLPVNMVNEGLINTVAYSLWLNDLGRLLLAWRRVVLGADNLLDASSGNILFGGIDTEKYEGELTRIDIYPTSQNIFTAFVVALTSLEAISPSGEDTLTSQQFPIPVVLDSGTTMSYLPTDLANQVWREVGAIWSRQFNVAVIPCGMQNSKGYFSFGFAGPSGPQIRVGMDELVLDMTSGRPFVFASGKYEGQNICTFGVQNFTTGPYLLGDTFLRSAYVVYDLVNNQIGLAATDFNSTDSNIVPFPSMGAQIPSATAAPRQAEVTNAPQVTMPAFAAEQGFLEGASESENAAPGMSTAFGVGQMLIVGVTMVLTAVGSGLFVVL
jgi:elongation factor G